MKRAFVAVWVLLAAGAVAAEDTLILKDGKLLSGKILAITREDVQIETAEGTMRVPVLAIEKIDREMPADAKPVTVVERKTVGKSETPGKTFPEPPMPEATPKLLAWIEICIQNLDSDDEGVRTGVTAALRSAGTAARPALERAANGNSARVSRDAKRLLAQLKRGEVRREEQSRIGRTRTDEIGDALGLDEAQAAAFGKILERFQLQQREVSLALREGEIDVAEAADKMGALRTGRDEELAEHLSAEQLRAYRDQWASEEASSSTPARHADPGRR